MRKVASAMAVDVVMTMGLRPTLSPQSTAQRCGFREEDLGEHQRRCRSVDEEVIPLDGAAGEELALCLTSRLFRGVVRCGLLCYGRDLYRRSVRWVTLIALYIAVNVKRFRKKIVRRMQK